jgi:signal transduction histidine kinase
MGLLAVMGLFGSIGIVAALSDHFRYYLMVDSVWYHLDAHGAASLSVGLFVVGLGGLVAIVWTRPARLWRTGIQPQPAARRIDYALIVLSVIVAEFLCVNAAFTSYWDPRPLLLCAVLAYVTALVLLIVTVARLRDRCLVSSISWARLWKTYPVTTLPGLVMAVLGLGTLVGAGVCMAIMAADWADLRAGVGRLRADWWGSLIFVTIVFTFGFACLTWLNTFLTTSAERADEANAEKLRAERFKAELLANVSHDVRTPLTSIINYVDLLKAIPDQSDQAQEYIGVLDRKSSRLKYLLSDLIEASKLTTGHVTSEVQAVELTEIVGQVAGEWDDQFTDRRLTLVFRQPEKSVLVSADSNHLWRVLENLFSNAAKYALPGTRVFSDITVGPDAVTYRLKNTSADPIDLPGDALTEQFIRGDRSRHTDGNGLGLYIARSLAETMGATLTIRADGDLFEAQVVLPVVAGVVSQADSARSTVPVAVQAIGDR